MSTDKNSSDISRSAGFAYSAKIEQDKTKRSKARSFRPLRKLWPFVARYPVQLILFLVFLAFSSLMTLALSFIGRLVTDCGSAKENAPQYCENVASIQSGNFSGLFLVIIAFAIAFSVVSSLRAYLINVLGQRVVADIRSAVYSSLMHLSPAYFERVRTGEVLSRLTTDTTLVETVVTGSISFALRSIATTTGALIWMFFISWKLTTMVLLIGPLIIIPVIITGKRIKRLSRDGQDTLANASARAGESLSAIQTVQAFTREQFEIDNFNNDVEMTFQKNKRRLIVRGFLMAFIMAASMISLAIIIRYGAHSVQSGEINEGAITQFIILSFLALSSTSMLSETWTNLLRAAGASERLTEILDETPDIQSPDNPQNLGRARGEIRFENLDFFYPTRLNEKALSGISFAITPGDTVALVGPSGAGKSTLFQLLMRFYDPQSGRITLDNIPIQKLTPETLRKQFAFVQQATPLFSGSAMDNIRYGREGASDAEVILAAKAAFAHEFIEKLPNGYQTDLGEKALTLSGGQQQRIAIARAILRNAPILLLDEATSALDAQSERTVQNAFMALAKDRTTLVIAHRLATVKKADRIIVMEYGKIIDQGTHSQLVQRGGLYAKLAKLQFSSGS
ncbi:MAG: ABC transporter transmembrane domain-containing protein [Robiginitomaculum sp.]